MSDEERNIPTGVGNPPQTLAVDFVNTEHPHGRGENNLVAGGRTVRDGTSPRAWGKPELANLGEQAVRNIPTGVGKTYPRFSQLDIL